MNNDKTDLTLFLRNKARSRNRDVSGCRIIEGGVLNYYQLKEAAKGQDIGYANLSEGLEAMARNLVTAMQETNVKKLIFINSLGIYDIPLRRVLIPYRKAADVI